MLTSTCAIFPCKDMDHTIAFYTKIGFELQGRWDDHGYLIFQKDMVELHFARNPDHQPETSQNAAYIRTDDVNGWSDELASLDIFVSEGFPRFGPATDRDWNMREMHILDPDGHLLRVGQFPENG